MFEPKYFQTALFKLPALACHIPLIAVPHYSTDLLGVVPFVSRPEFKAESQPIVTHLLVLELVLGHEVVRLEQPLLLFLQFVHVLARLVQLDASLPQLVPFLILLHDVSNKSI